MSTRFRVLPALAWLVPVGVLVQAGLAGQALFGSPDLFTLHGTIGSGVLLLSLATAALAWLVRVPRLGAVLASLGFVALIGQTGLGYAGRRGGLAAASALHVPLGAAVLALTVAAALVIAMRSRATTEASTR